MLFCAPLGAVIILKSVIYDGWRQFYFLYGLLIIIAMNGLEYISSIKKHHKIVSLILIISLIIQISTLITWMYRNHPFQNVYFNALAADDWHQKYEMDYWGLSDVRALEHIVSEDPRPNIKVWSLGHTSVPAALKFMGPQAQSKLAIVDQISDADYVVYNYRDVHPSAAMIFSGLIANAEVFYEIKVDGHAIITVFKQ